MDIPKETDIPKEPQIFLPPNVSLHLIFSRHAKREDLGDFGKFRETVRSADIIIPEEFSWTEGYLQELRAIAKGDTRLYHGHKEKRKGQPYEEASNAVLETIFASHKQVVFVDVERESDLAKELMKATYERPSSEFIGATWEETLQKIDENIRHDAELQAKREDYILSRLGPQIKEAIDSHPKLKGKEKVSVVMMMGQEHTRIFDELEKSVVPGASGLPSVTQERLATIPIREIVLKNAHKSGEHMEKTAKVRLLAEIFVKTVLLSLDRAEGRLTDSLVFEQIVDNLSMDELKAVYESRDARSAGLRINANSPVMQKIRSMETKLVETT